jgi:hypothetical protein
VAAVAEKPRTDAAPWPGPLVRWVVWAVFAVAWTTALLVPKPISSRQLTENVTSQVAHEETAKAAGQWLPFSALVHLSAYGVFAVLSGWQLLSRLGRWLLLAFVLGHGILTEFLQWLLPTGRTGCVEDVGLDWLGVLLGLAVTWKWWQH